MSKTAGTRAGPQLAVVGVGHGGGMTVGRMAADWPDGPRVIVVGTDREMLARLPEAHADAVLIGESLTRGVSTGGDPELGRQAAEADRERLQTVFEGVDLAFLAAGLGGGLGTGALPVMARMARASGTMTVCLVTLPFDFEGEHRRRRAEAGLSELQDAADVVVVIPNQKLFKLLGGDMRVAEAFARADAMLSRALYSVWRMIVRPGVISLDYADLRALLKGSGGLGAFGYGEGTGPAKADEAARQLLTNPLLDQGRLLHEAGAALVSVTGGPDLTLAEIDELMRVIRDTVRPEAHLAMGAAVEEAWRDRVSVTVLASETWRADHSGQMHLDLAGAGAGGELAGVERRRESAPGAGQGALSLEAAPGSQGRFKDAAPTVENGENLDVPTFIRRRVAI